MRTLEGDLKSVRIKTYWKSAGIQKEWKNQKAGAIGNTVFPSRAMKYPSLVMPMNIFVFGT
jgi:hypothetical protein